MTDDTTDTYLEKEINVIMMGSQLDQRFRAALLGWAKMLMHRARRDAVKECAEIANEDYLNYMASDLLSPKDRAMANMAITIKQEILSLLEQKP